LPACHEWCATAPWPRPDGSSAICRPTPGGSAPESARPSLNGPASPHRRGRGSRRRARRPRGAVGRDDGQAGGSA
jgi:hypothetical protein